MRSNYASEYGLAIFKLAAETGAQKEIFDDFTAVKDVPLRERGSDEASFKSEAFQG